MGKYWWICRKNKKDDYVSEDLNKTSVYIHQKLKEIGRTKIYYTLESNAFTDLLEKKSNTKIFYYNSSVNTIYLRKLIKLIIWNDYYFLIKY